MALGYLLLLADHLLELLRGLAFEKLLDLEYDVSFVQALLIEVVHWARMDDFERLLGSLEDPLCRTIYFVSEMSVAEEMIASSSNNFRVRNQYNLRGEFTEVTKRLHEIVIEIRNNYETFLHSHVVVEVEDIIEREKDKTEIRNLILHQHQTEFEENVRVIPVFGDPGVGKTTLARIIYKDGQIQQGFELRLWVFMGDNDDGNTRKVVMRLLESAGIPDRNLPTDGLQREFQRATRGKRCFIVMDDMVDDDPLNWLSFKDLLKDCARGTCVLLTTNSRKIAHMTHKGADQYYCLDRLTEEESWSFFKRKTFKDISEEEVQEKEKLGEDIASKCMGVPLSLRVSSTYLHYDFYNFRSWWKFDNAQKIKEEVRRHIDLVNGNAHKTMVARQPYAFVAQDIVVGRGEEKQVIIEELLEENLEENPVVIPIVGIGGLGKTALAQLIFNDEQITESHFDLRIWVGVTDGFVVKEIIKKIIYSVTSNSPEGLGYEQLVILLRQQIRGKRYLLILDDVCSEDEDKWKQLMDSLSDGAYGSRIIVTTRSEEVAKITGEKHQHQLQMLDEDNSWKLFLELVFVQREHPTDQNTIDIGKKIVKMCSGIPLAIRTLASVLFTKDPETEWQSFFEQELPSILSKKSEKDVTTTPQQDVPTTPQEHVSTTPEETPQEDVPTTHEEDVPTIDVVQATLELSYDQLSSSLLRKCFHHCALFPKGYEIDVETLICLWMSQGFMDQSGQQDLETSGYDSFIDLLGKSFFQVTEKDELGKITKCKMQNLMHDLARKVAGDAYATISLKEDKFDKSLTHVSFDFHLDSSWQIPNSLSESKVILSLILPRQFRWATEYRPNESICDVILKLKSLKMLDLHNSGIKILPDCIGELIHLCYLDLSQNVHIKSLPSSISCLEDLQTLKLNDCSNLQTLPRGITMLSKLRNLENESCYCLTHMPQGLHKLSQLRRLSEFVLSDGISSLSKKGGKLDELAALKYLKGNLKIKNLRSPEDDKTAQANLIYKKDLLSLILTWDINASVDETDCEKALEDLQPHHDLRELSISAYGGSKFSNWLSSHDKLVKLYLSKCNKCHCLPPLDLLPKLEVLVVDELLELKYILGEKSRDEFATPFSSLKELRLTNLPELENWWKDASENVVVVEEEEEEEVSKFTCLSKLVVEDCPKLASMPLFPCLKELLVLKNSSWMLLERTLAAERERSTSEFAASSSSSTNFPGYRPLSQLRALHIIDMPNPDKKLWQSLPNLRSVTLDHLADINGQLEGLQHVTGLQQLHIWRCDSLEEIPRWIRDSESLKTISIKLCPNLTVPREKISLITSFEKVEIEDCPAVSHLESMLKDPLYSK